MEPRNTQGRKLYELGDGQWNIPALRTVLEDVIPKHRTVEAYEVEHEFPTIGRRVMLLNARQVFDEDGLGSALLVAIEDVTQRRDLEREKETSCCDRRKSCSRRCSIASGRPPIVTGGCCGEEIIRRALSRCFPSSRWRPERSRSLQAGRRREFHRLEAQVIGTAQGPGAGRVPRSCSEGRHASAAVRTRPSW